MYGTNLVAVPYVKCDLVTFKSGPHKGDQNKNYLNIYGFETLPPNSVLKIEVPNLLRINSYTLDTKVKLTILEETWGYNDADIELYSQTANFVSTKYLHWLNHDYDAVTPSITLTNSVINKVTNITISNYNMGVSGVTSVIFEVDQTQFPDIGRGYGIACGSHTCSKFNKPIQYFILTPSSPLAQTASFTFPNIATPKYAGGYTFKMRFYKNYDYVSHISFTVTITPEPLASAPTFTFDPLLETETVLYPNTLRYHKISFTTVNALPAGTGSIKLTIDNGYILVSQYCTLKTTPNVLSYDSRPIQCIIDTANNIVNIYNMQAVPGSTTFSLVLEFNSVSTASTISPRVSV